MVLYGIVKKFKDYEEFQSFLWFTMHFEQDFEAFTRVVLFGIAKKFEDYEEFQSFVQFTMRFKPDFEGLQRILSNIIRNPSFN